MESFTELEDKAGSGGDELEDITGLEDCQAWCRDQDPEDCFEFDFNVGDESCWIFPSSFDSDDVYSRNGVNHYIRNEDCIGIYSYLLKVFSLFILAVILNAVCTV